MAQTGLWKGEEEEMIKTKVGRVWRGGSCIWEERGGERRGMNLIKIYCVKFLKNEIAYVLKRIVKGRVDLSSTPQALL